MDFDAFMAMLEQRPIPERHSDRTLLFIRELAEGVVEGFWGPRFEAIGRRKWQPFYDPSAPNPFDDDHHKQFLIRWDNIFNNISFEALVVMGYIEWNHAIGALLPKAFDLLQKPLIAPNIFISYKRSESLLLALLLEARLRNKGIENVFVDKELKGGDKWPDVLQEHASKCEVMIVLATEKSLQSKWVQQEIQWALESPPVRIIPIAHKNFSPSDTDMFQSDHWIEITDEETPFGYEDAIARLLNALGYSTY